MYKKWTFTLLLAALCTLPGAAQTHASSQSKTSVSLNTQVERAVTQATAQAKPCTCHCHRAQEFSEEDTLNAETELQHIRNADPAATFEQYPYLLDPAYRHQHDGTCNCQQAGQPDEPEENIPVIFTGSDDDTLSPREQIEAEEELSLIRNRQDDNATFAQYPHLLDPAYRRAETNAQRANIRHHYGKDKQGQFTPSYAHGETWARKVGL